MMLPFVAVVGLWFWFAAEMVRRTDHALARCVCPCNCLHRVSERGQDTCWPCRADIARVGAVTHLAKIEHIRDIAASPLQEFCLCGGTIVQTQDGLQCSACGTTVNA